MLRVRPYEPGDRPAVRRICFETGFMGEPVHFQYDDPESFADLFTRYYTDAEPGSAFVAVRDAQVVGYLLGCCDTKRAWGPVATGVRALGHVGVLRPRTFAFHTRLATDLARDQSTDRGAADLTPYPAHLHLNLSAAARGHGAGSKLFAAFEAHLRSQGIPGVHLTTFADNTTARAFFGKLGFVDHGAPVAVPGFRSRDGRRLHAQHMVQPLR